MERIELVCLLNLIWSVFVEPSLIFMTLIYFRLLLLINLFSNIFQQRFYIWCSFFNDNFEKLKLAHRLFHVFINKFALNWHSSVTFITKLTVCFFAFIFLAISMTTRWKCYRIWRYLSTKWTWKEKVQRFLCMKNKLRFHFAVCLKNH